MRLGNTPTSWGAIAKGFHWVIAALVLFLVAHGWWMTHMVQRAGRLTQYQIHSAIGYDLLLLLALRVAWRAIDPAPPLPRGLERWERIAAHSGHVLLYLLAIGASLTGWVLVGTFSRPIDATLFGFIPVPALASGPNRGLHQAMENAHEILSYSLLALAVLHVLAALRHHFVRKNDVLRRMWWERSRSAETG